ncbi:MAG: hypothetical protein AB1638_06385 [Nitrospirota bacterium]
MKFAIWYLPISVLVWVFYGSLLSGWWYFDDPNIVLFASQHGVSEFLFNPSIWQSFSPFNLTPWVLISLKADHILAGFYTSGYYLHQIISLVIVAFAVFNILNLYVKKPLFAFIAVIIFLLSPSTLSVTSWLSTRHYLEGLGFALLSIYFYIRSLRDDKLPLLFLATLFYGLAIASKEIYVPLPFLCILLPVQKLKRRLIFLIPLFLLTGVYILYRAWMLGDNAFGGYSAIWPWNVKSVIVSTPKIFKYYGGSWWIFFVVFAVILWGFRFIDGWTSRIKEALRGVSIFSLFYIPIVPVSPLWGGLGSLRYFFLTSLFITFCYSLSLDRIFEKSGRIQRALLILSVLPVTAGFYGSFVEQRVLWDSEKAVAFAEGNFFLENSGSLDAIFKINQPHWFFDGLEKLKREESKKETDRKIRLVSGDFYGFDKDNDTYDNDLQVFSYDYKTKKVVNITKNAKKGHEEFLGIIKTKPLSVFMNIKDGVLNLKLGPYEGQYILLEALPSKPDFYYLAFPVNKEFAIKLTHRERPRIFRFAYISSGGWTTLSPNFLIDHAKDQTIRWERSETRAQKNVLI